MANNINFFDTYYMAGMVEEIVPETTFFRDRYFNETEEFGTEKVLVEYMDGDRKMAPFVDPRAGDIPVEREGYELYEFTAPMIAPSRVLTIDDLTKRLRRGDLREQHGRRACPPSAGPRPERPHPADRPP